MRVHVSVEQQHVVQRPVSDVIWLKIRVRLQRVQTLGLARIILSLVNAEPHFVHHQQADFVKHIQTQVSVTQLIHTVAAMTSPSKEKDVEDFLVADCNFKRACIKAVGDVNARLYARKMNEFHLTVVYRVRVVKKETRVIIPRAWIRLAGMFVQLATMHQRLLTLVKRVQPTNIRTRIMNLVPSVNLARRAKNL